MVRRGDLVLATQGRAFWIVDDLSPLRQYSASQVDADLHLYEPARAYRRTPTRGEHTGGEMFSPSAPEGALIYYALGKSPAVEEREVVLEILNSAGKVLRRLATNIDTGKKSGSASYALSAKAGVNRALWDLRTAPTAEINDYVFVVGAGAGRKFVRGYHVAPGTYRLRLTHGDAVHESAVEVAWDPINDYDPARIAEQQQAVVEAFEMVDAVYRRLAALPALKSKLELHRTKAAAAGAKELTESAQALLNDLNAWRESVSSPEVTNGQDLLQSPPKLEASLASLYGTINEAILGLTQGQRDRLADLRPRWEAAIKAWERIEARIAGLNN